MEVVGDARGRFTVRFYMVAMLFILFDVEAVFMLPWAVIFRRLPAITGSRMFGFWEMLVYLGFVAVGLFYVWKKGILNWAEDQGRSLMYDPSSAIKANRPSSRRILTTPQSKRSPVLPPTQSSTATS